ncbi:hypothetical protein IE53DRAFT_374805 [Violaceomyces palustris]|uniref:Uncharacterized protein n=1 Tax=Violaceomyces palustris TaxID=1673888 RepID=A0ACD0NWG5_9BASI|nr:hypothetical protein IE53DRAFT_374805 [Violaceomyces palustris]
MDPYLNQPFAMDRSFQQPSAQGQRQQQCSPHSFDDSESPRSLSGGKQHNGGSHCHSQSVGHNSLGLLDGFSGSTSVPMTHSQSTPAFNFGSMHNHFNRRGSMSSSSSFSVSNASESATGGSANGHDAYSPRSFTQNESPLGSLSSISGLAIDTPHTPIRSELGHQIHSPFVPGQHDALLALSHGQDDGFDMPPPGKRRAVQSIDAGAQQQIYTESQAKLDASHNSPDEATPMPPSTGTFGGHTSSNLSDSVRNGQIPLTPVHGSSRALQTNGSDQRYQPTPGDSHSVTSTPDYSVRSGGSAYPSPYFNTSMAPRVQRMDSFDGTDGLASPASDGNQNNLYGRTMAGNKMDNGLLSLSSLNNGKTEPSQMHLYRDQLQSPISPYGRNSMPEFSMNAPAMMRVASAPSGHMAKMDADMFSMPSTPASATEYRRALYPQTPGGLPPPSFDPYFSAPAMSSSKSVGPLGSPGAISPQSLLDGRSRSISGTPGRGTPRSRTRNSGPPPLIVSSADKLHVCHCGKRFKRMEHLKRHNRTHTQERPHRCPVETCGKYFGRSDNLAQHLKTHFRPAGLVGRSSELLSLTTGSDKFKQHEPRHDPHAAANSAAAAAAAAHAAGKRRSSIGHVALGGPIALNRPQQPRQVLSPSSGAGNNANPLSVGLSGPIDGHQNGFW